MYSHASMNRIFRLVWNDVSGTWVAVSEFSRGRVKRSGRAARRMAALLTAMSFAGSPFAAPPVLAPGQLPTGGNVTAGNAALRSAPGGAVLNIDQSTQRAVIDWGSFNVGSGAQVNFNQPGSSSVTLNRVLGSDASQIAGRISAPGQVFLTNPNGVIFGKTATVDVGGLTATTLGISDADFMAGKTTFANAGSAGAVVNEGTLRASLGGYIALLAPEVRNQGVVIARMGTVALAAGNAISLDFDGNRQLAGITVTQASLKALVDNRGAVLAPGGFIVLSAQALDRLQGGVVNNSGRLEATGLSTKAGRIVLEASDRVEHSGSINVDAAGRAAAGQVTINAQDIAISGSVSAASLLGHGGSIVVQALGNLRLTSALVDASGAAGGGDIHLQGGATPAVLPALPDAVPTLTVEGSTRLRVDSGGAFGGRIEMTADSVFLLDQMRIDASGASGGGSVAVGGGWQGSGRLAQARRVTMAEGAEIDASATQRGKGGTISLWSDIHREDSQTSAHGTLQASGGTQGGDGGDIETSGHWLYVDRIRTRAAARSSAGRAGQWLLDPYDVTISTASTSGITTSTSGGTSTYSGSASSSNLSVSTITSALNGGTNVTVSTGSSGSAVGDITVSNAIAKTSGATDVTLTLKAANSIIVNADVTNAGGSGNAGKLNITLDADNDNGTRDGAGIVILNAKLSTNGGAVNFGTGATLAINGTTTKVGGDVYVGGSTAQTINTAGGAVTVNGEMIIANTAGLSINTAGGNVTFGGLLNSGDTYALVSSGSDIIWTSAYTAAKGSTAGAAAVGDTYLATITSRLENAVASRSANYTSAWLGARRGQTTANATNTATADNDWRWVAGPEGQANGGTGLVFFNGATTSGSAPTGAYNNWSSGEPNNSPCSGCGGNESALQFTGAYGRWNDLWPGSGQTGVTTYVRETNLAGSPLAINAGAGTVTFSTMVGGTKALGSLSITAGTVAINGGGVTSEGAQSYNAAVTLGTAATVLTQTAANADFTLPANRSIVNTTGADARLTVKTTGNLNLASGSTIHSSGSAKLNTVLWADSDANGGSVSLAAGDATFGSINTNGGHLWIGGGSGSTTFNGLTVGNGVAKGVSGQPIGIRLQGANLQSGAGSISLNGEGGLGGGGAVGVLIDQGSVVSTTTGSISLRGQGSLAGTAANNEGVKLDNSSIVEVQSGSGNLSVTGTGGTGADYNIGVNVRGSSTLRMGSAATGTLNVAGIGSAAGTGTGNWGVLAEGGGSYVSNGAAPIVLQGTGGGGSDSQGLRANGATTIGNAAMSGDITLRADTMQLATSPALSILGTGALNILPLTAGTTIGLGGGAGTLNLTQAALASLRDGFSAITIGRSDGTGKITVGSVSLADNTQLLTNSADIQIDGALNLAANRLTLTNSGNVTEGGAGSVLAGSLLVQGAGGSKVLGNAANAVTTLAANTGSLGFVNSQALTIGDVGAVSGVQASGTVSISTTSGDLTLTRNVSAGSTGNSAVVLNAGSSAAAGITSGGNIVRPGSSTVSTGSGGRATLMTGSVSGSTGLVAYAGSGSGRFRYGSDETTTAYSTALTSGLNVVYREQPAITITANAASKVYDGVAYTGGNGVVASGSYLNGDTSASTTGSATYGGSAQNASAAGSYTITPGGFSNGLGYGLNYVGGALTIGQRPVTFSGSRAYDGTTDIASSALTIANRVGSDALTLSGSGTLASKTVGSRAITSTGTIALGGAAAANYTLTGASGSVTLSQAALTVTAPGSATKTYDGTTNVAASATVGTLAGAGAGETVLTPALVAYANANAGTGKTVQPSGLQIRDSGGADVTSNYTITYVSSTNGVINPATLTMKANDDARFISESDTAGFNGVSYSGFVGNEGTSVLTGTPTVSRSNAGTGTTGAYAGVLEPDPTSVSASNYTIAPANGTYTIVPADQLLVKVTNTSTVYGSAPSFGSVSARYLDSNSATINTLTQSGQTGNAYTFDDGAGGTISVSLSPQGVVNSSAGLAKIGNYAIAGTGSTNFNGTTANAIVFTGNLEVTRAALSPTASNVSKVYDGTTGMTGVTLGLTGRQPGDVVTVSGTGAFSQKNVGTGLSYSINGLSIGGTDADNYYLNGGSSFSGSNGTISAATLQVSGVAAVSRAYDATTAATLSGSAGVIPVAGDAVSLFGSATASFADKNVGANKAVTVTGLSLTGTDAANYTLALPAGLTANITPAALAVGGTLAAVDKVYNATSAASLTGTPTVTALGGDVLSLGGAGAASFADKNVGANKAVTVSGYTLGGADASNYALVQPAGLTASITQATLATGGNLAAVGKVYDANTIAALSGALTVAGIGGDTVSLAGTGLGSFADKNAGTNKAVTVSGYTLAGADAGNYALVLPSLNATITPAALLVGGNLAAVDKVYNGSTAATLTGSATVTAIAGDTVSLGGAGVASFGDKNVGAGKAVTVSGYTLGGADAGNYALVQPAGLSASITAATLTTGGNLAAVGKVYDATTTAALSGSLTVAGVSGDAVSLAGSGVGSFANKNVGTNKAVTVGGYTLAGADAGNYTLVLPSLSAAITPATLLAGGNVGALDKTYDAGTLATLTGTLSVTALGSDVVGVGGTAVGAFANKNAGTNKAVTVSGYTLTGADAGNYTLVQPTGVTATITPALLLAGGNVGALNKTYDATTAATLTGAPTVTGIGSDVVGIGGSGVGTFANKNAGTNKAVTVSGYTLTGADAGNYTLVAPTGVTATITQATLTTGGNLAAVGKVYDANTVATLTGALTVAGVSGDAVSLAGSGVGSFASKNVGTNKAVTVSGLSLTGADAGNYALVLPSLSATITPAALLSGGNVAALNRAYDGTTAATLTGAPTVTGIGSDVVGIGGSGIGTFADKNAGTNKAVTVSGYTLTGADAGNYTLVAPSGVTATITQATLTTGGNLAAVGKVYDANTAATLTGALTVAGVSGDTVSLAGSGVGSFADKNVGTNKAVTVSGLSLTGADAGNYALVLPSLSATITPAALLSGGNVAALDRSYDGSTAATLTGSLSVTAIGNDVVAVGGSGVGRFADKNAGANKAVAVSGYTLTGADAGNYTLVEPSGLTATISPAALATGGSLSASGKVYDASTVATLTGAPTVAGVAGDVVSIVGSGAGSFADKNVGTNKAVTVSGFTLAGVDAGNYALVLPSLSAAIVPATLLAGGNVGVLDKTYDASSAATLTGSLSVTAIGNDVVAVGGSGVARFADKNVGANKAVAVSGFTLTGADAGNYTLAEPSGLTANITPASLLVGGSIAAAGKTYDATNVATLTGTPTVTALGSDAVSVAGSGVGRFADKNAGRGKAVTVSGFTLVGDDAGNYALVEPIGLLADITPRALGVTATAAAKVYDGSTAIGVTLADDRIAGDLLALGYGSAALADKNAGTGKTVNINGLSLSGADAGNYAVASGATASADVAKATLQVSASGTAKTYDATTAAAVTLSDNRVAGDLLVLNYGSAQLADKNAGSGKAVSVAGISVTGADAGNYSFNSAAATTADVGKATLTVNAVVQPRAFDGSTAASVTLTDNRLAGDQLALDYGAAGFADAAIGAGKPVSVTGIRIAGGADQANYVLAASSAAAAGSIVQPPADTSTATLAPVLVPVAPTPVPTPPPAVVDLVLPASPIAPAATAPEPTRRSTAPVASAAVEQASRSAAQAATTAAASVIGDTAAVVSVALTRPASVEQPGIVMVSVPKPIVSAGAGFNFPMPTEMAQLAGSDQARVTLVDGTPLPQWLTFSGANRSFNASVVPAGALPVEVLVRIGAQEWTVIVNER